MTILKKLIKKNYEFILCIFLFAIIIVVCLNPKPYIDSSFVGIKTWATIVLPSLFFFFIISKIILQFEASMKITRGLDVIFSKMYNVSNASGHVFLMSAISGYPLGAKLTYELYNKEIITKEESHRLISFCSTSGPMFIIGSVGTTLFENYKLGIIILICHLLSALVNGLIYRNYKKQTNIIEQKNNINLSLKKETINDIMYNTIISVLMVGGFITICFTLLEILNTFNLFFNPFLETIIKGVVEVTNGCVNLSQQGFSLKLNCIILTGIITFGGISTHLQSYIFLSKIGIKYKFFLLTKITQTLIAIIISLLFSIFLL